MFIKLNLFLSEMKVNETNGRANDESVGSFFPLEWHANLLFHCEHDQRQNEHQGLTGAGESNANDIATGQSVWVKGQGQGSG